MSPRFTLWHSRNTRSLRILWTFKELSLQRGRDYTLNVLKFPPRQHHAEFLERNPLGTVPWFEHQEAADVAPRASMSESCAVPLYVAELLGSPIALRVQDNEFGGFLNWLHHGRDAHLSAVGRDALRRLRARARPGRRRRRLFTVVSRAAQAAEQRARGRSRISRRRPLHAG
jgi:glutathione S-transferase